MKNAIYILGMMLIGFTACQEDGDYDFRDTARIQFRGSNATGAEDVTYTFYWLDQNVKTDTVYLPVNVSGGPSDQVRHIRISQIKEYDVEYEHDHLGYITDSTVTERPNMAEPGVHYLPFDAPEMQELLVVKPHEVKVKLPIILKRDASLKQAKKRLRVQLEVSADFQLGEKNLQSQTIEFSDQLDKPEDWDNYYWGNYSLPKHELMIRVVKDYDGSRLDGKWFDKAYADISFLVFWRGKFVEALNAFNDDPENIASGLAPLREDPENPSSPILTFPNKL